MLFSFFGVLDTRGNYNFVLFRSPIVELSKTAKTFNVHEKIVFTDFADFTEWNPKLSKQILCHFP